MLMCPPPLPPGLLCYMLMCPPLPPGLLCDDLMVGAEVEEDYSTPEEGNLLYKLYSLQDLLLLVRSDICLAHTRRLGTSNKVVPVYVLSKMEYQLSYGVESLTKTEACRLWAETRLHSSTVPYIGKILLHSSTVPYIGKILLHSSTVPYIGKILLHSSTVPYIRKILLHSSTVPYI
uniref:Little elongation complex subunit 2 C-terminal domain-containing protein n=1 Tax=Hucho hucho TaxID=62062 RepID=A0A4W5KV17_9TELE